MLNRTPITETECLQRSLSLFDLKIHIPWWRTFFLIVDIFVDDEDDDVENSNCTVNRSDKLVACVSFQKKRYQISQLDSNFPSTWDRYYIDLLFGYSANNVFHEVLFQLAGAVEYLPRDKTSPNNCPDIWR